MTTTLVGVCLVMIVSSLGLWLQVARSSGILDSRVRSAEDLNRRLAEIDLGLRQEKLTAPEADAARIALIEQIRGRDQLLPRILAAITLAPKSTRVAIVGSALAVFAASAFLSNDVRTSDAGTGAVEAQREMAVVDGQDTDAAALELLKTYTRSLGAEKSAPMSRPGTVLPDVDTMIDQLAARLEGNPGDAGGWRMLGWSYFHTGRYDQSVAAYARAVALEPNNADYKTAYDEAKSRATSDTAAGSTDASVQVASSADKSTNVAIDIEKLPSDEREQAIRSMVESLASRLESSPIDADGWIRLIRSRTVLGERDKAATALNRALDVFKTDDVSQAKIAATAKELGLAKN